MINPIKPSEVGLAKVFPDFVISSFNTLIARHFNGCSSTVLQKDAVELINKESAEPFKDWWLNIEETYRSTGWKVEYDKPAYNETYDAAYKFTVGKK